jgi:hypothetical protein
MKKYFMMIVLTVFCACIHAQNGVPLGIHYQAVARNNNGTELTNTKISVKFSIISGDPLGTIVYQELHQDVITSKFGVFSLVIGHGVPTGASPVSSIADISWKDANHYLKVEVKFGNDFMDMGTMQFLAVPYALYAQKSLEPGPTGQKGDKGDKGEAGDPASDKQTLSFDGKNLSIYNGNTVNLSTLNIPHQLSILGDTLSILGGNKVALTNQIQDLQLDINNKLKITKNSSATEIDLNLYKQDLSYNPTTGMLSISNGTGADISTLKTDAIQDIHLNGNILTIDKNSSSAGVDLTKYLDDTDKQQLNYNESTKSLSIDRGNRVTLGTMVAFRAKKQTSIAASSMTDVTFLPTTVEYNNGLGYNSTSGEFTASIDGIYTFSINYFSDGSGGSRKLTLYLNTGVYEEIAADISSMTLTLRSLTMKLLAGDVVKLVINTGASSQTGTGSFSGFKVY